MSDSPPPWQTYRRALVPLNYGDALWEPAPIYSYKRIRLGDVGYIREGRFHLLFSAGEPLGTRVLGNDVPHAFEPLDVGHIIHGGVRPAGYLRTTTVREIGVDVGASTAIPCPIEPGAKLAFELNRQQGAVLVTKHETYREDIERRLVFERYTKKHYNSWVDFAREHGHDSNPKPVLVTGVDLTRDFAMVAYSNNSVCMECEFSAAVPAVASASLSLWGRWRTEGLVHTNCGPRSPIIETASSSESGDHATPASTIPSDYNQCVFIRYYAMRRRGPIVKIIRAGAGPHDLGDHDSGNDSSDSASSQGLSSGDSDTSDVVVHNLPLDDTDDFDTVAEAVFQKSNAEFVLLHHDVISGIRRLSTGEMRLEWLAESDLLKHILVDENGVGYFDMTHPQFSFLKGKTPWKKPNAITDPPPPTGLLSAQPLDGALSFFAQADDNHFNQSFMEYNSTTGIELGSYSSEEPISLTFCRSSSPFRLDYSQLSVPEQTNYFCSLPQQTDSANEMVTNTDDTTIEVNSILDISPAAVGTDVRSSGGSFFIPPRIYDIRPGIRPVFMAIFHPYPQHANMEVEEDVGRVARWLGSIVQPACFNAFYYKPSTRNTIIIEVLEKNVDRRRLLGEHIWKNILLNPSEEEKGHKSCIFHCVYNNVRDIQKKGWKRIDFKDTWFMPRDGRKHTSLYYKQAKWEHIVKEDGVFRMPYPLSSYCEIPMEDPTDPGLFHPLPIDLFPVPGYPRMPGEVSEWKTELLEFKESTWAELRSKSIKGNAGPQTTSQPNDRRGRATTSQKQRRDSRREAAIIALIKAREEEEKRRFEATGSVPLRKEESGRDSEPRSPIGGDFSDTDFSRFPEIEASHPYVGWHDS